MKPTAHDQHDATAEQTTSAAHQLRPWKRRVAYAVVALQVMQAACWTVPVQAQTVAYKPAPSGQKAIMDAASNGTPIAHIAPPSAAGVSRNHYEQFNVDPNGLILNNSSTNVQTVQGGWISGNLQLGPTPARIILNEVVTANPSSLRGTIEVAGRRADIVIANPNGISCDGCGFLNAGRATMATAQVQFGAGGAINGFDVKQGQVTIGSGGINATNLEQLDLLARGIVIDGEIWAKNLNVIAGANQVLYGTLQAAAQSGTGTVPRFAVDIKELGGMYANHIYLVGTEKGLGVNSTGRIAALQGNVALSANGDLTLKDTYAKQNLSVASQGATTLTGQTQSEGATTIFSADTLSQQGSLDVQGPLGITANSLNNTGTIVQRDASGMTVVVANKVTNRGVIQSGGDMTIGAAALDDNRGVLQANGTTAITAGAVTLNTTQLVAGGSVRINSGSLNATDSRLRAGDDLAIAASGDVTNSNGQWQAGRDIAVQAAGFDNRGSTLLSQQSLTIDTRGGAVNNANGNLVSSGTVATTSGALDNSLGLIQAGSDNTGSAGGLTINAAATNNSGGQMLAREALVLTTGSLTNNAQGSMAGVIASSNGSLTVHSANVSNVGGLMTSATGTRVTAKAVDNRRGEFSSGAVLDINTGSEALSNSAGRVIAGTDLLLRGGTVDNSEGGLIAAGGDLALTGSSLNNDRALIGSGRSLMIDTGAGALSSRSGTLQAGQSMTVRAGQLSVKAGNVIATDSVVINATGIDASDSIISGATSVALNSAGAITTARGAVLSNGNVSVTATALDNSGGTISARQQANVALGTGTLINTGGRVIGSTGLALQSGEIVNAAGVIASGDGLAIDT